MQVGIKAKSEALKNLQKSLNKNDGEMARLIGCSKRTYQNAISGENVGTAFIGRVSLKFNTDFGTYFQIAQAQAA